MRYINGEEVKIGDQVVIITSGNTGFYPYLTTGTVISIGTETKVTVQERNGKIDTKLYDQIYPI